MVSPAGLVADSSLLRARHEVMAQAVEPLHFSRTVLQRQTTQGLDFCIPAVFACSWPWGQIAATKHKVLVIAHALQAFDAWEVIPPLLAAEKAVGAAVAQDSAALWTSPAEKADIKKRLVMLKQRQSTTAVRQASGRRRGSHVEMPSAIKGKKVLPTLRDGALLCALSGACAQSEED